LNRINAGDRPILLNNSILKWVFGVGSLSSFGLERLFGDVLSADTL